MIFLYLLSIGVTFAILHARDQLTGWMIALTIVFWPFALIAAFMVPEKHFPQNRTMMENFKADYHRRVAEDETMKNKMENFRLRVKE
jgi:hypothetical protein